MTTRLIAAAAILLCLRPPAAAHRLDEYLQATLISVEKDRVQILTRLIPGVAVSAFVLASIDTNADGVISNVEARAYAARVLHDLSLTIDGDILTPKLVSVDFPPPRDMQEGLGEIKIEFTAGLPPGGRHRRLIFENHHQPRIGAYLVNCLVPRDPDIKVLTQNRNEIQSFYQLDYEQANAGWRGAHTWLGLTALLLCARFTLLWRRRPGHHHSCPPTP